MADKNEAKNAKDGAEDGEKKTKKTPAKKGAKGNKGATKEGKSRKKAGPNTFLLFVAVVILTLVMLWVTGVLNFAALTGQELPPEEDKTIANAQPTGSTPVTFAAVQADAAVYTNTPEAAKLAKIYSDMRPEKAAEALGQMPVEEAVPIIAAMDEWRAGIIMSKMEAAKAVEISQLLAETYRRGGAGGQVELLP